MPTGLRLIATAACLLTWAGCACRAQAPASATPDYQFTSGNGSARAAFNRYADLILIDVSVNGSAPVPFALDTGIAHSVIDSAAARALRLTDPDQDDADGVRGSVSGADLKLSGFAWTNRTLAVADLSALAPALGIRIDGILGGDLFERFVVAVDYKKGIVTIIDPSVFDLDSVVGKPVALHIRHGVPKIAATLSGPNGSISAMAEIDTGSIDDVTIGGPVAGRVGLPAPAQAQVVAVSPLGGQPPRELARITGVAIGGFALRGPIACCPVETQSGAPRASIGAPILSRFTIVFDYPGRTAFFAPNQLTGARGKPFAADASGLTLDAGGPTLNVYQVTGVVRGSPADTAGLHPGDLIRAIDSKPVDAINLDNLRRLLELPGKKYVVQYSCGSQMHSAVIKLKSLL